jgi:hypothetical protein
MPHAVHLAPVLSPVTCKEHHMSQTVMNFQRHHALTTDCNLSANVLQPTCFDRNVVQPGNQTFRCDSGLLNDANLGLGPPSDELCCWVSGCR